MTGPDLEQPKKPFSIRRLLCKPQAIYTLAALAVMLPMLLPGYIFALDMAFTPHLRLPEYVTSSYPFYAVLHFLNLIIPSQILQKAMLLLILVLSGYGMHQLIRRIQGDKDPQADYGIWGAYFGGLLYMVNPFTYSRFMVGQFAVLLGYALLPFFVTALMDFSRRPKQRTAYILAAWTVGIGIVSIHSIGLLIVLTLATLPLLIYRYKSNVGHLLHIGKYGLLAIAVTLAASSYWIVPLMTGSSTTAQAIGNFTEGDQRAFATLGSDAVNKVANVLQLQGFWADAHSLYELPQNQMPIWGIIVLLVWALVIIGAVSMARHGQRFSLAMISIAAAAAIVLASTNLVADIAQHVPFFAGYREPQKFVALVALMFAVCGAQGVTALIGRFRTQNQETSFGIAAVSALLIPILLTPTMLWGFSGQLKAHNYPPDWTAMNTQLQQDKSDSRVLFVPWHQYMSFGFTDRIVVNPAEQFFDKPTIVSNDLEFGDASPTVPDREKDTFTRYLKQASAGSKNLGKQLASHDVEYVLLAKDNDYQKYEYLDKLADFQMTQDTSTLRLYHNLAYGRAHGQ